MTISRAGDHGVDGGRSGHVHQPAQRRTDDRRDMERRRVQRNRVAENLARHQVRRDRLRGGHRERARSAEQHQHHEHRPHRAAVHTCVKPSSSAAQTHFDDVARCENEFAIVAVRDLSGRQHQHDERHELREADQAEVERIVRDRVHLPADRDALHLHRERRDEPRDEIQREVAVLQRPQNCR